MHYMHRISWHADRGVRTLEGRKVCARLQFRTSKQRKKNPVGHPIDTKCITCLSVQFIEVGNPLLGGLEKPVARVFVCTVFVMFLILGLKGFPLMIGSRGKTNKHEEHQHMSHAGRKLTGKDHLETCTPTKFQINLNSNSLRSIPQRSR